ncbi:DUF3300 domain-containing protein [Methyloligella solikamskensis]|uniref:DUF3300 domain-containing protein n=1 Tax=Methyloligella solikamskensis TaxID=1177756 RepID=A0ABW3JDR3_9HYPH
MIESPTHSLAVLLGAAFILATTGSSIAQDAPASSADDAATQVQAGTQNEPAQSSQSSDDQQSSQLLDAAQLDQLVAPIALYPDPLLAQVLIASTYPLEVVQADRWLEKNKDLKGEDLDKALNGQDWDNSIKSLVEVPDVLDMMNKDLDWTSKLGDAVLAQQADVMDAVQRLRAIAKKNGKLTSNDQQTVKVTTPDSDTDQAPASSSQAPSAAPAPSGAQAAPQQVIVIEPTNPQTIYVPYYQPSVVYGGWPYPDYPPYYFAPPPGYIFGGALATGLAWSAGFAIGNAIWGDGFDWHHDNIHVNVNQNFNRNVNINKNDVNIQNWQHDSYHRRGVNYDNTNVRNKVSQTNLTNTKNDLRNRADGASGNLGDKRPSVGDLENELKNKPGSGDGGRLSGNAGQLGDKKPGGGNLADKRPNLANKPDLKKPNIQKPDIKRPDVKRPSANRPSVNAFDRGDGARARDFADRGRSSLGGRSARDMSFRGGRVGGGHMGGGRRR